jgi:hypothetical protein
MRVQPGMLGEAADHTSAAGAVRLAERIKAYWRAQGDASALRVWVEPIWGTAQGASRVAGFRKSGDGAVRSNLVSGLPPPRST